MDARLRRLMALTGDAAHLTPDEVADVTYDIENLVIYAFDDSDVSNIELHYKKYVMYCQQIYIKCLLNRYTLKQNLNCLVINTVFHFHPMLF